MTFEEINAQHDELIAQHAADPIATAAIDKAAKLVVHMVFRTNGVTVKNFTPKFAAVLAEYPDHKELARQSFKLAADALTALIRDTQAASNA